MANILTRKLELFGPLSDDDRAFLDSLIDDVVSVAAGEDIICEGENTDHVRLIVEGMACRYKILGDASRQIVSFVVPGDLCNPHVFILKAMDHSIGALSACHTVNIERQRVLEMFERPAIARALWWSTLVDEATLREWVVNLGQRDAKERLAHLFCEMHTRLESIGLTENGKFSFPVTQADMAAALGISGVHVNRALQSLRAEGLVSVGRKEVVILDVAALKTMSQFDPNYLHLTGGKQK
jgi:CRP-like cAMP-binding protein